MISLRRLAILLFLGCNPQMASLDNLACDADGACVPGYVCDRDTWICGPCLEGATCTLGDPCVAGLCTGGVCVGEPRANGEPCDDGAFCTVDERCTDGVCGRSVPRVCGTAGGVCRDGACNEVTDTCDGDPLPDGTGCDDGAFCTVDDQCAGGVCRGAARACVPPGDNCNTAVCVEAVDACELTPMREGGACDDGAFCTVGEICTAGVCGGGGATDCSARADQCNSAECNETTDQCDRVPLPGIVDCDDGNVCTTDDICTFGLCASTPIPLCEWAYRKPITILAAGVPGDLVDFPVLIDLPTDADLAARALDNGNDLIFTDAAAKRLSHEIETFDGATGRLLAWVRIEALSSLNDTRIYLYYGNPNATWQEDAAGVWDDDYAGVWHMHGDAGGVDNRDVYLDSTANGNHGNDFISATDKAGQIGRGQRFDGVDDYADFGTDASLDLDYLTVEMWYRDSVFVTNGGILARGTNTTRRYWMWTWSNNVSLEVDEGSNHNNAWNVASGSWVHLAMTYDGSTVRTFKNGSPENSYAQATGPIDGTTEPLLMGLIPGYNYFGGHLDEVRLSRVARSASWIRTAHNNQSSPTTFSTTGPEE